MCLSCALWPSVVEAMPGMQEALDPFLVLQKEMMALVNVNGSHTLVEKPQSKK